MVSRCGTSRSPRGADPRAPVGASRAFRARTVSPSRPPGTMPVVVEVGALGDRVGQFLNPIHVHLVRVHFVRLSPPMLRGLRQFSKGFLSESPPGTPSRPPRGGASAAALSGDRPEGTQPINRRPLQGLGHEVDLEVAQVVRRGRTEPRHGGVDPQPEPRLTSCRAEA